MHTTEDASFLSSLSAFEGKVEGGSTLPRLRSLSVLTVSSPPSQGSTSTSTPCDSFSLETTRTPSGCLSETRSSQRSVDRPSPRFLLPPSSCTQPPVSFLERRAKVATSWTSPRLPTSPRSHRASSSRTTVSPHRPSPRPQPPSSSHLSLPSLSSLRCLIPRPFQSFNPFHTLFYSLPISEFPSPNSTHVKPIIKLLSEDGPRTNLAKFTSFRTRYYRSDTGKQSSEWLLTKIQEVSLLPAPSCRRRRRSSLIALPLTSSSLFYPFQYTNAAPKHIKAQISVAPFAHTFVSLLPFPSSHRSRDG